MKHALEIIGAAICGGLFVKLYDNLVIKSLRKALLEVRVIDRKTNGKQSSRS